MSIAGKYNFVDSDKYDEYLKEVGVGMINRTMANAAKPTLEFIDHGNGKWTQKTLTALKNFEISFTVGEEFDEHTADDRKSKSLVTINGTTLVHKQSIGDVTAVTTREFTGDTMKSTFTCGAVTAVRNFKKVA